ncbi:MAG: hypothetical protein GX947_04860 [Tissierellia bacterium]|nr:hypothetical protein [Tissierellia bacterium]
MKKVLGVMAFSIIVMIFFGGAISIVITKMMGGGVDESYIYPIYGGIILLSGLIVGCTVIIINEFKEVKDMLLEKGEKVDDVDYTIG